MDVVILIMVFIIVWLFLGMYMCFDYCKFGNILMIYGDIIVY